MSQPPSRQGLIPQAVSSGNDLVQRKIDELTVPTMVNGTLDPDAASLTTLNGKSALRRAAGDHLLDYHQALSPAGRDEAYSIFARSQGSSLFLGKSSTTGCAHFSLTSRGPMDNFPNNPDRPDTPGLYTTYWGFDGYSHFRTDPTERTPHESRFAGNPTAPTRSRLWQVQNADDLSQSRRI
jgi:hypothetical protein